MAKSKSLKSAVKTAVKDASDEVTTGNEQTVREGPATLRRAATGGHIQDRPTGTRRNLPSA
jgi:ribosomal protein S20